MSQSFEYKKELKFVLTLGTGQFGSSNKNTVTLQGLRATADIDKAGGAQMSELRAKIYGVPQSDMNSICTLQWKPDTQLKNKVQVYAIDGPQETMIYSGMLINAWGDYQGMPDVFLMLQAQMAYDTQLTPSPPISFNGQTDAAAVMQQIASGMGFTFENNGVNVQLSDIYLPGTLMQQAKALARHAGIQMFLDDPVLAICPANAPRNVTQIPLISSASGMVGYPTFDAVGVNFRCLFNPAVKFGAPFQLQSDLPQATGQFYATSLGYHLESEKPGGMWFMQIRGTKYQYVVSNQ